MVAKFKVGDRVRIKTGSYFFEHGTDIKFYTRLGERTGVVASADINGDDGDWFIGIDGGRKRSWVNEKFLSLLSDPEPVETYSYDPGGEVILTHDVVMGDTIAVKYPNGSWSVGVTSSGTYLLRDGIEIRLLHRPEPEVDPVQVKAMVDVLQNIPYASLKKIGVEYADVDFRPLAAALVEAGVTAPITDA